MSDREAFNFLQSGPLISVYRCRLCDQIPVAEIMHPYWDVGQQSAEGVGNNTDDINYVTAAAHTPSINVLIRESNGCQ